MQHDYNNPNKLLTRQEASEFLGVSKGTLEVWATTKRYNLKYIKIGKNINCNFISGNIFNVRNIVW